MNQKSYEELKTICEHRASTRSFNGSPVSDEDIQRIRHIALTSPYASGRKNWELLVVNERSIIDRMANAVNKKSRDVFSRVRDDFKEYLDGYARNFVAFSSAPVLFIPVFRVVSTLSMTIADEDLHIVQWERDNFVKSISCVAMLILLAAESLGLASCYMTGPLIAEEEIAQLIGVKRGYSIGAVIPVGYPAISNT